MQVIKTTNVLDCIPPLASRLISELSNGHNVLWLVPGGSNIPISVSVMEQIPGNITKNLTILLTDERFGPIGHKDSNTVQLELAGFKSKQASVKPVLHSGMDLQETIDSYADDFGSAAAAADIIIAQFGIGPDGHIAGILPDSPAVRSVELTCGYEAPNFTRITLTPEAFERVDVGYAFAFGDSKHDALTQLQTEELDLSVQPSQLFKQIPEAYLYTDQLDSA